MDTEEGIPSYQWQNGKHWHVVLYDGCTALKCYICGYYCDRMDCEIDETNGKPMCDNCTKKKDCEIKK